MPRPSSLLRLAPLALAACSYSSLDDEIFPEVLRADVAVDRTAPDDLAPIRIRLELRGGPRAGSPALLDKVVLDDTINDPLADPATELLRLDLRFPITFDPYIDESETKIVDLENFGTRSADLEPLCGQDLTLTVSIADANEGNAWTLASAPVTVACP